MKAPAIILVSLAALVGCSDRNPPTSGRSPPTSEQAVAKVRNDARMLEQFVKVCDSNGGIKDYDGTYYENRYRRTQRIRCNNGGQFLLDEFVVDQVSTRQLDK